MRRMKDEWQVAESENREGRPKDLGRARSVAGLALDVLVLASDSALMPLAEIIPTFNYP